MKSDAFYKPSPLQTASYHESMNKLIKGREVAQLFTLLTCGISPNPCSESGNSVIHRICRRGDHEMLQHMFLDFASTEGDEDESSDNDEEVGHLKPSVVVRSVDGKGRTPLHDACCAKDPFAVVALLTEVDRHLFLAADVRGLTPLAYVQTEDYESWISFLDNVKDTYWPVRTEAETPISTRGGENTLLPDPEHPVSLAMAKMIINGDLSPSDANILRLGNADEVSAKKDTSGELSISQMTIDTFSSNKLEAIKQSLQGEGKVSWT